MAYYRCEFGGGGDSDWFGLKKFNITTAYFSLQISSMGAGTEYEIPLIDSRNNQYYLRGTNNNATRPLPYSYDESILQPCLIPTTIQGNYDVDYGKYVQIQTRRKQGSTTSNEELRGNFFNSLSSYKSSGNKIYIGTTSDYYTVWAPQTNYQASSIYITRSASANNITVQVYLYVPTLFDNSYPN